MEHSAGIWSEALVGRCLGLHASSKVIEAARLIGQALDLGLITLQDAAAVNGMTNSEQLEGWLCALAADVALAGGELVTGGAA
jgi:hypothetical protein